MKKLISIGLTLAFAAGSMAFVPAAFSASAEETKFIKPMAHYEFDDASLPGKDTSGNGFDLKTLNTSANKEEALQIKQDTDGENYLSLVSDRDAEDKGGKRGACLYAPQLGSSGKDFSDLIEDSYTVSITFRRDNSKWQGDHYMLAVGRYNDAFQITPWKGCIQVQVNNMDMAPGNSQDEKQAWLEANTFEYPCDTTDWTTVTVSTDAVKNEAIVYVNGEAVAEPIKMSDTFFTWRSDPYAFTLGAQCQFTGNAATCYATADIKECRVYDSALSAANVKKLYEGEEAVAESEVRYITAVESVDTSQLDLLATDVNTVDVIMSEVLPQKTKITLSNGTELSAKVAWYVVSETKIKGYIQSAYANADQLMLEADYGYTVRFEYDDKLVRVSQIKLDGNAYTPGTPIDAELHALTFKVTALGGEYSEIDGVSSMDMEWDPEDDEGNYYVSVSGGAQVVIEASAKKFTVTYYDGTEKLGTSKYSYQGSEELKSFDKSGYTFVGWYTDADLTQAFTTLDYENPADIALYAKYEAGNAPGSSDSGGGTSAGESGDNSERSGCGSVVGISAGVALLGVAAVMALKKRR